LHDVTTLNPLHPNVTYHIITLDSTPSHPFECDVIYGRPPRYIQHITTYVLMAVLQVNLGYGLFFHRLLPPRVPEKNFWEK